MKRSIAFLLTAILIFTAGCGIFSANKATVTEPTSVPTEQMPTAAPQLTMEQLKNAMIFAPQLQKNVQLKDGKYESGSGADYALLQILPQSLMADLNGDGNLDGVVLLAENGGGSGVFVSLIPFLSTGDHFNQGKAELIDDRPQISSLTVTDGRINLDALVHTDTDPMVSPSRHVMESFQLYSDFLVMVDLRSTISDAEHSISISAPVQNQEVTGSVQLIGSMPFAPFENNLRLRIYDDKNQVASEVPFMVQAEDMGKPATFDQSVALPAVAAGTSIRLELADLSAKDGSAISIASINLIVK